MNVIFYSIYLTAVNINLFFFKGLETMNSLSNYKCVCFGEDKKKMCVNKK